MRLTLVMVLLLAAAGCTSDPRSVRITEQNKATFMDPMKAMSALTSEERRLLYLYVLRSSIADSVGGSRLTLVGKTVGDLIDEERAIEANARKLESE